jgi:hypothetical protein
MPDENLVIYLLEPGGDHAETSQFARLIQGRRKPISSVGFDERPLCAKLILFEHNAENRVHSHKVDYGTADTHMRI